MKHIMVFLNNVYRPEISLPSRQLALLEVCGLFFLRTHKYLMSRIKNGVGGGDCVSRNSDVSLCDGLRHCLGMGLGPGGEALGQGCVCATEDLEPRASEPPGARALEMSPDGRAVWYRCTNTCLPSPGRTSLR